MRTLLSTILLFIVLIYHNGVTAYNDTKTHPHLTERAVEAA